MVEETSYTENVKLNQILDSAQKRFKHYGLAKTTMTEIASDIGLSKASLYYYFTDKDTLFRAVVKREQDLFIENIRKMIQMKDTAENKILKYVDSRNKYSMSLLNLLKINKSSESINTIKPLLINLFDDFFNSEIKLISEIIKEGIQNSEFENIDVSSHADLLISAMNGLRYLTVKDKDTNLLEPKDYTKIKNRIKNLTSIFIKAIIKR
jgi:AcrR family transcriptional regulator